MKVKGIERVFPTLDKLVSYTDQEFSSDVDIWPMAERVRFASNLFEFLTAGQAKDSDEMSFLRAVGEKEILWNAGYWNVGTQDTPILWGVEGCGDEHRAKLTLCVPVVLRYELELMYNGESEQEITPWHKNLLNIFGASLSGREFKAMIGEKKIRFSGVNLSEEQFVSFATSGSGSRLLSMARTITEALKLP